MHTDENLKRGEIVTDGDEWLIVDNVPALTGDVYVVDSFEGAGDLIDDSDASTQEDIAGTRSMGAATGTTHRGDSV